MSPATMIALQLIILHRADGHEVLVNPAHIALLEQTSEQAGRQNRLVVPGTACVVGLADAKFLAVRETCDVVRKLIEDAK